MQREGEGKGETGYWEKGIWNFMFLDSILSKNQKQWNGLECSAVVKTDEISFLN